MEKRIILVETKVENNLRVEGVVLLAPVVVNLIPAGPKTGSLG